MISNFQLKELIISSWYTRIGFDSQTRTNQRIVYFFSHNRYPLGTTNWNDKHEPVYKIRARKKLPNVWCPMLSVSVCRRLKNIVVVEMDSGEVGMYIYMNSRPYIQCLLETSRYADLWSILPAKNPKPENVNVGVLYGMLEAVKTTREQPTAPCSFAVSTTRQRKYLPFWQMGCCMQITVQSRMFCTCGVNIGEVLATVPRIFGLTWAHDLLRAVRHSGWETSTGQLTCSFKRHGTLPFSRSLVVYSMAVQLEFWSIPGHTLSRESAL